MSSPISTPGALSSETRAYAGTGWRLVEAQHRVSTLKLTDSIDEQAVLEELIEAVKPPLPPECRDLHYLLSTPFRYDAPYPRGSRFRRAGMTPGVFYAAEAPQTAVAELAFHRLMFFAESPDIAWPANPAEFTAFAFKAASPMAIDLTAGRLARDRAHWTNPTDYTACQTLADAARGAGIEILRYASVRDPAGGTNIALLNCRAFAARKPGALQTWRLRFSDTGVQALCEAPKTGMTFDRTTFAGDPRIAALRWERR